MVLEASGHSPWVDRLVRELGHRSLVADARRLPLISKGGRKCDRNDAETLARLAHADPKLLNPVTHRRESAQADLAILRSRDAMVRARTSLVNHVRGVVKSMGSRLVDVGPKTMHKRAPEQIPEELKPALMPVLDVLRELTESISEYDNKIERLCKARYPETATLRQISGVGAIVSLTFLLTLGDPRRFPSSRTVGSYLGLTPRLFLSGSIAPELPISKAGDRDLRRLLIIAANYVLGLGPDCDLQRWGRQIAARGGKKARQRAKVAVARKLAVLMHRLWVTAEVYDPFHQARRRGEQIPDAA